MLKNKVVADEKTVTARKFCQEVRELAQKHNLPFFVVTDGASTISNNGCEPVSNARSCHERWEQLHNIDSQEDWSKNNNLE